MQHANRSTPGIPAVWTEDMRHAVVDIALEQGLTAMRATAGLGVDPWAGYDVLAVALRRALGPIPGHLSVDEVLDALGRRAVVVSPTEGL